ncbi:MAG: DUF3108 domain-containing protein [Pyrinomonadaceae bacterium]|nr:DUF3108 domain-containing protein [Pyrinomonadaceae bacterium]
MKRELMLPAAAVILLFIFVPLAAQSKRDVENISFSPSIYRVGERLTYNVSFSNFINAAHIELFIANGGTIFDRPGLELRAHIETTEVVNVALYSINNDYTTFIDPATGIPFRSTEVIREGGNTSDRTSEYNAPVGVDAIPNKLRLGEFPGRFDFLSAIYRLRALPLAARSTYYFNIVYDQIEYKAQLKVVGQEIVKTKVGSFNTVITEVRTSADTKFNDYKVKVYFSDDERHVPVLITARYKVGDIRAEIVGSQLPEGAPQLTPPTGPVTSIPKTQPTPVNPQRPQSRPTPPPSPTNTGAGGAGGAPLSGLPFAVGEQLNFNFYLGNSPQPVGTTTFQVRARSRYFGRDGLLLAFRGQTNSALQRLFAVNDQINSYVDPTTLVPFRTELNLQEGRRRTNETLTIDQERGSITTDKGTRIEIPVGTHDIISVFYALRSFNLTPTKRTAVSLLVNDRPLTLFITALKRETIELGSQKVQAVQLSLTTDDPQSDRYALRLWVSDDRRRLPLRITATTPLGPVRADLAIIPVTQQ